MTDWDSRWAAHQQNLVDATNQTELVERGS
jgi:hypothetical protein